MWLLVAIVFLALAAPAPAATVAVTRTTVQEPKGGPYEISTITYQAAAGEANDLTVAQETERSYRFIDAGAVVTAGRGCQAISEHEVLCTAEAGVWSVSVDLGDADDAADTTAARSVQIQGAAGDDRLRGIGFIQGGPGNDQLTGAAQLLGNEGDDRLTGEGAGDASLRGGPGADVLTGAAGDDMLHGEGGADVLLGGDGDDYLADNDRDEVDADQLDGGPGVDRADFTDLPVPLHIDLAAAAQMVSGPDRMTGIERVTSGDGDDVLTGDDGANVLQGFGGADRIAGAGGDDLLEGATGEDVLDGGAGDDRISGGLDRDAIAGGDGDDRIDAAPDFFADSVDCGPGTDVVLREREDRLAGCERPRDAAIPETLFEVERRGRRIRAVYVCVDIIDDCRAFTTLHVRVGRRWVGLGRSVARCGVPVECLISRSRWVALPRSALRRLRRERRLIVRVVTEFGGGRARGAIPLVERRVLRRR